MARDQPRWLSPAASLIWQVKFTLVPKRLVPDLDELPEDTFEQFLETATAELVLPAHHAEQLTELLPPTTDWHDNMEAWAADEPDFIEIRGAFEYSRCFNSNAPCRVRDRRRSYRPYMVQSTFMRLASDRFTGIPTQRSTVFSHARTPTSPLVWTKRAK